jgi:iron complex transport system substrate-binding protein
LRASIAAYGTRTADPGRAGEAGRGPVTGYNLDQLLTRRQVLAAGLVAGTTLLAGCRSSRSDTAGWRFVDDRNHTVRLDSPPTRIVAYISAAAALHDWGLTPVGVFGASPREDPLLARFPWRKSEVVGSVYGEIDLDKLLALGADLIVSRWYPLPPDEMPAFGFKDLAQQRTIGAKVPIVAINGHATATRQIGRFGDLAAALGVDTTSGAIARARAAFVDAQARLSEAAKRKSNLRIIAISADQTRMYVSKLVDSADLTLYQQRGVPLVSAQTARPYWDRVPWADAAKYPADGVLYDTRAIFLPLRQAREIPTFAALPAVRANQIGGWRTDPPPSYQAYTVAMNELAKTISGWRKVL